MENSENQKVGSKDGEKPSEIADMPSFNPSMSDELEEDLEKIKGDAIGDTLYSERFVLSTLLKVVDVAEHANFEQDLCTLWDMTIEHDVVKLLLEHQTLEIFSTLVKATDDKRLTEILVGIIANMCDYPPARKEISKNAEIVAPILDLISCTDGLTLVQLMRFLSAVLVSDNDVDALTWFGHLQNCENFVDHFSFILSNSMSREVLSGAIEAMTAFCIKFSLIEDESDSNVTFRDLFVRECLVSGLIEAFKTLSPAKDALESSSTTTLTTKTKKLHTSFLDINVMLLQYEENSTEAYSNVQTEFLKCIAEILAPFCDSSTLFSVSHHEIETLDSISEVFELLSYPFEETCFIHALEVFNIIETTQPCIDHDLDGEWNKDDAWNEIGKETSINFLELFIELAQHASDDELKQALGHVQNSTKDLLLKQLIMDRVPSDILATFVRIKNIVIESRKSDDKE